MTKFFIVFMGIFYLSSCATFSINDIPDYKQYDKIDTPYLLSKDVTFSVHYLQDIFPTGGSAITNQEDFINDIRDAFKTSNLFHKVHYVPLEHASNYHYHFNILMTGTQFQEKMPISILWELTLGVIPMWWNYNLDISMHLFVDKQEVYSVTAPQRVKDVFWLPLFLALPILNHGTVGNHVENEAVDYFISEIIENRLYLHNFD